MTDKVQKIREEVERLRNLHQMKYQQLDTNDNMCLVECGKRNLCNELLSFIDLLQGEPQVKKLAGNQHEDKTCKENGNSLTQKNLSNIERTVKDWKEGPVSKDFEMALAEMIDKAQKCVVEPLVVAEQWKDELVKLAKSEEPVSESIDFEQELYKAFGQIKDFTLGIAIAKRFYDMGRKHNEPVSEELK